MNVGAAATSTDAMINECYVLIACSPSLFWSLSRGIWGSTWITMRILRKRHASGTPRGGSATSRNTTPAETGRDRNRIVGIAGIPLGIIILELQQMKCAVVE